MDKLFNKNFTIFAVLALIVLGGYFLMSGDDATPAADNSLEAVDQTAAAESADDVTEDDAVEEDAI